MPCDSSYLKPRARERELQRAARLLAYVIRGLGATPPDWVLAEAENLYATNEQSVVALCEALRHMDPATRERIIYDAHNRQARDLANWWEEHHAADRRREAAEAAERKRAALQASAFAKLSPEERAAIAGNSLG